MCQMTSSEEEYHDLSGLCERCGEWTATSPCGACLDDERAHWSYQYEPGYALLVDTNDELPW